MHTSIPVKHSLVKAAPNTQLDTKHYCNDISLCCTQTMGRAVTCQVQAVSLVAINLSSWP